MKIFAITVFLICFMLFAGCRNPGYPTASPPLPPEPVDTPSPTVYPVSSPVASPLPSEPVDSPSPTVYPVASPVTTPLPSEPVDTPSPTVYPTPSPVASPFPPENVAVAFNEKNGTIEVTWDTFVQGVVYEIYRVQNDDDRLLPAPDSSEDAYTDVDYPLDTTFSYKVRSKCNNLFSEFCESRSILVNIGEVAVKKIKASSLKYTDKIRISWDGIIYENVAPEYYIYRFLSTDDPSPVVLDCPILDGPDGTKYLDDTGAMAKTPYYYSVGWNDFNTGQAGKDGGLFFGIYVDTGDENLSEPNDDWNRLPYSVTFPDMTDLFIYKNGDEKDIDCYKIHIAPAYINEAVNVKVDFDPVFNGKLKYQYIYNGIPGNPESLNNGSSNIFLSSGFDNPGSIIEENLIFKIIPGSENIKCTYSISFKDSW